MKPVKSVIITGANGFIGSLLVNRFFKEGYRIAALVKGKENLNKIEGKAVILDYGDMENLKQKTGIADHAVFYHFAWQGVNGTEKSSLDIQLDNIRMACKAAEIAGKLNCSKFLCAGSIAERSLESIGRMEKIPSGMMYAAAKQSLRCLLDTYCRQIGINHIWMQFANVYGSDNHTGNIIGYTLERILNGREAVFGPAEQPYDLLYADDLAEAVYRLGISDTHKHFYYIGSGAPRKLKSYLESIGKITGKTGLIKTGVREDDGIEYRMDMFSIDELTEDIGNYVSADFETSLQNTIENAGL